ncbi:MAG: glycoside hydrolase family 1 protein [Leptolyngbya sp. SIO4C1]|nr:glycoside hydrolase family 1 protein [Leptolyngbya sp. SIO4C1]
MPANQASQAAPFLWGVSTSGYQHEGGYNQAKQPQNNWAIWEQQGRVERTGSAADFWSRHKADFERCQQLGLTAFRLSIEWARVQPTHQAQPGSAPAFDAAALDAYADLLATCRRSGLEPLVTLHHFTHPAWLGTDAWLRPSTVDAYLTYVTTAVSHLNRRLVEVHQLAPIRWYITTNEPNILVTNTYLKGDFPADSWGLTAALQVCNQLLCAHVRAYDAIHDLYEQAGWETPQVSLNTYCSDLYWSEKVIWDLLSSRQRAIAPQQLVAYIQQQAVEWEATLAKSGLSFRRDLPYRAGRLLRAGANWLAERRFSLDGIQPLVETLAASPRSQVFDYIALDYYDPFFAHSLRLPTFFDIEGGHDWRGWVMSSVSSKWWDWRHLPEGLFFFCQTYAEAFGQPILIAENGMALRRSHDNRVAADRSDRLRRSQFLQMHVAQVRRLQAAGVPLLGYFHWSLVDNYEWGSYTPRFGLFSLDFEQGTERLREDHLRDCPSETYERLIKEG